MSGMNKPNVEVTVGEEESDDDLIRQILRQMR
jgi:hypothetical protein